MSKNHILEELEILLEEYSFQEISLKLGEEKVSFSKARKNLAVPYSNQMAAEFTQSTMDSEEENQVSDELEKAAPVPAGHPVISPMTGIYYGSPTPDAPAFVKPGSQVSAGQVVALVEAMKVFNEITSPIDGVVLSVNFVSGTVVNNGDALVTLGI